MDELTGRDWLLFLLIQSCTSNELRKKILNLPDNEITLENVLALARKYESTEVACKEKDTINNIFRKKEKKGGKATPSQPLQQPDATQSSKNANANQGKPDRRKEVLLLLRGGVHLRAQAKLPGKGGHLQELQEEGPPRSHLLQWKTFKRKRASCFRISNTGIWSSIRFCGVPGVQTTPEAAATTEAPAAAATSGRVRTNQRRLRDLATFQNL
jgi:hypothetical protein